MKAGEFWTYLDVAALCGEPMFDTSAIPYSLLDPQVIFEILSPSTEIFDRNEKFARYQKINALIDYVLVASETMRVEHFARQPEGGWLYREYHEASKPLELASVAAELPLAEIYERVVFPERGAGD